MLRTSVTECIAGFQLLSLFGCPHIHYGVIAKASVSRPIISGAQTRLPVPRHFCQPAPQIPLYISIIRIIHLDAIHFGTGENAIIPPWPEPDL